MKMTTSYNLTKRNDQGEELTVNLVVEDEVNGKYSQQEMKERMQAETKALQEALNMRQQSVSLVTYEPEKREKLKVLPAKQSGPNDNRKATENQVRMIVDIIPKMNASKEEICQKYQVNSLTELSHKQVNDIKKEFDRYREKHPDESDNRGYQPN